jgi:putative flippase GtrA
MFRIPMRKFRMQLLRFIVVGLANTLLTAVFYLIAVPFLSHTTAYFFAFALVFAVGIALQARVTFGARLRPRRFSMLDLISLTPLCWKPRSEGLASISDSL